MRLGGTGLTGSVPLQKQKADIVDQLLGMNNSMKDFSGEVESKLEHAYNAIGGAKKYGYDASKGASEVSAMIE
jgi:hypothetical protein